DVFDREAMPPDGVNQLVDLVARIDHHRFARLLAAEDVAVLEEWLDGAGFQDHARRILHLSQFPGLLRLPGHERDHYLSTDRTSPSERPGCGGKAPAYLDRQPTAGMDELRPPDRRRGARHAGSWRLFLGG